jgi:uncharacterized protein
MTAFIVDLATLKPGVNRVHLDCEVEDLGLPPDRWHGRARGELDVEKTGEQVTVRGYIHALADLECFRCTRPFELSVRPAFEVFADRSGSGRHEDVDQELERDEYMQFHDGRQLDLSEAAREVLLLELPIAPRCREDCRGLCPRCGADLNEGPCGCRD